METTHQYLDKYPIPKESEKLIVGTIHPHDHDKFEMQFFYGNKNSIWNVLSEAFPKDLKQPITFKEVENFLKSKKIALSDTIRKCVRESPTALDKDLIPIKLNTEIIEQIINSNINEILFTSGFAKNNAFKLFYIDILGNKKIPSEVRKNREIILEKEFGRPVKLTVLYSPSGSANVGLSKSKLYKERFNKYEGSIKPISLFKIDYYKEKFS